MLLNAIKLNMYETQALARADNRSIGIILCAEKDRVEVEIALEDMGKPIGVADYQMIVQKKQKKKKNEIKNKKKKKKKKNKKKKRTDCYVKNNNKEAAPVYDEGAV